MSREVVTAVNEALKHGWALTGPGRITKAGRTLLLMDSATHPGHVIVATKAQGVLIRPEQAHEVFGPKQEVNR